MSKPIRILIAAIVIAVAGGASWWYWSHRPVNGEITLYGNVDLRQASVAFNGAERIQAVLVEEGDTVKAGQVLARLDVSRLKPQADQAEAAVSAQKATLLRLTNGNRPEDIAQARANLAAATADSANAKVQYERKKALMATNNVSKQDLDSAKAAADMAAAKVDQSKSALDLQLAGSRYEDVEQAQAQLRGYEAQAAIARQQLADAELLAPFDGVIRSRLMEPGEMAAASKPVFSIASTGTKWIRAYVSETNLGRVRMGEKAAVQTDSFPGKPLDGWVGFISPVAEFTPKTVQTEDLRSSLVYEVRIFAKDPDNILRLGMPATVRLLPDAAAASTAASRP